MSDLIFLKLGGSLITDKTSKETARIAVLNRIAGEIVRALKARNNLKLLIGHGSGSFGHVAAAKRGTRQGVRDSEDWFAFAEVSSAAARLNSLVRESLIKVGVPAATFQPSASAFCEDGRIVSLSILQIRAALDRGLVPVVYGDVAFDRVRGGTIISTEEIFTFIAQTLRPTEILLAGETDGVLDAGGLLIPSIQKSTIGTIRDSLGGSRGTDVTGGMAAKVEDMLALVESQPDLRIRIFSGMVTGAVEQSLINANSELGTLIGVDSS